VGLYFFRLIKRLFSFFSDLMQFILCHFLDRQKVTKKLLMPKGDFAQEAGANHG